MLYGMSSTNDEWPNGEPRENEEATIIVCVNDMQRKMVAQGFQKRARHILPGKSLSGKQYDRVIIFTPQFEDGRDVIRFKQYIEKEVLSRLKYSGKEAEERIHYV